MPYFCIGYRYICNLKYHTIMAHILNKYIWLAETIYKAKKINFKAINQLWMQHTDLSYGAHLPLRTFHKWRIGIEELLGLIIDCDRKDGNAYYISNLQDLQENKLKQWIFQSISQSNLLMQNKALNHRILLEDVPSSAPMLSLVLQAMQQNNILLMQYKSYWDTAEQSLQIAPYCLKLFRRRWYVLALKTSTQQLRIYSLDRILSLKPNPNQTFTLPTDFDAESFFAHSFGIIHDGNPAQKILLKVSPAQANYLRSLPLHPSQQENRYPTHSIFNFKLRPTFDFIQEILSFRQRG